MTLNLCIAGISISIKGRGFSGRLSPSEKKLLEPFKVKRSAKTKFITVHAQRIPSLAAAKTSPSILKLAQFMRDRFFHKDEIFFKAPFEDFVKNILTPYLKGNTSRQKKIATLLNNHRSSPNTILFQQHAFLCRNNNDDCYELVQRKTNPLSREHFLWMHNLSALKLLFRIVLNTGKNGALLHASSVEQDGAGYVFVGPGNSGKSTITRMLKPDRILSDDMTVIKKTNGGYEIFANPWWNAYGQKRPSQPAKPVPLKALFFIKKAQKTCLKKLDYKNALSALIYGDRHFQQSAFVDNKEGIKAFYLFAQELLTNVPAYHLCVKKSKNFRIEFLESVAFLLKN